MSDLENVNKNDIEWIKDTLRDIKDQTTKTNGRVTRLENFKVQMVAYITFGTSIAAFVVNKLL